MADDMIDIEEHDVLENPIIKQIFPDLSILKKEIIGYNDETQDNLINLERINVDRNDEQIRNSRSSNSEKLLNKRKEILLGSNSDNITSKKGGIKRNLFSEVKVSLKNISPELTRSQKFCQICSILFSKKEDLYNHRILYHSDIDHQNIWHLIRGINDSAKRQNNSEIYSNNNISICRKSTSTFVNNTNEADITSHNKIRDTNIMVKISDSKLMDSNTIKPCFHCSIVFPSYQSLIDHLYEILNNKNSNIQHTENNLNKDSIICAKNKILQCESINIKEINKDQKKVDCSQTNKLYRCPICSYYFNVKKFYLWHLLSKHKLSKTNNLKSVNFFSKCKFCDSKWDDVLSYNRHLRERHRNEIVKSKTDRCFSLNKNRHLQKHLNNAKISKNFRHLDIENYKNIIDKNIKNVRVMVLKVILFKCNKCNVYFLTSEAARNHIEHSESLEHWRCTICCKTFKEKQKNLHEKQHKYSNYFTVVEVNNDVQLLYQHSNVVQLREENSSGQSDCETEQLEKDNTICDNLIENDQEVSHQEDQLIKHSDCNNSIIDLKKCNTNRTLNDMNPSHDLVKNYKQVYFCSICKCNIPNTCNVKDHLQSICTSFIKCTCEYCGLAFTAETISLHRTLHHKYSNLQLQDFIIIDLNTKTNIRPISDLPKCESCEKHFIFKDEIVHHQCEEGDCVTCPVCEIKLTNSAYKLHEPFHRYILKKESESRKVISNNLVSSNIVSNLAEVSKKGDQSLSSSNRPEISTVNDVLHLYTCTNCDISMNVYDDAVEHCHLHTHLNKIEAEAIKCTKCNVNFDPLTYNRHQQLHDIYPKNNFKYFNFDVFYFNAHNDKWLKHVFDALPKNAIHAIIGKSIYKYENKIRMEIIQDGPYILTIYKCDKCQSFSDSKFIYDHISKCSENCTKFNCKICHIPFINNASRIEHEQNHLTFKTTLKSYRIVIFNREKDKAINRNVSKAKYFVLFECRYCHVLVDKNTYNEHKCYSCNPKSCNICGLLLQERNYDTHVLKHRTIGSFNKNSMKVVLIGNKTINDDEIRNNKLISTFNGMVSDYTFYKCEKCEVCIREFRNTIHHYCLIDAAKSKCPECDLIFDEGKIKGHLKLHDTDPDITKDTIIIKNFDYKHINKEEHPKVIYYSGITNKNNDKRNKVGIHDAGVGNRINNLADGTCVSETTTKIYKCYCGLHFINETQIREHSKKCSGIVRVNQSRQDCFKCGLTFNSNVLFKHLLEHHGGKNVVFKYEIIENYNNVTLSG